MIAAALLLAGPGAAAAEPLQGTDGTQSTESTQVPEGTQNNEGAPGPESPQGTQDAPSQPDAPAPQDTPAPGGGSEPQSPPGPGDVPAPAPRDEPLPAPDPAPGTVQQDTDCTVDKCIALTFDDGPGDYTDHLLDTLDAYGAEATFYLLGSKVADNPETVKRMADEGHEVGNHSWDHEDLTELSPEEIGADLARTDKAIAAATGSEPETVRPPYGALNESVHESVTQPMMLWDVDTLDWKSRDSGKVTDVAVEETSEGSVLLFHDIHRSTVEAIPQVLEQLSQQGYTFVTVDELFDTQTMEPGAAYSDARLQ